MALETFEVCFGQLVFQNAQRLNQTRNMIENRILNKPTFRDVQPTIFEVPAGKYGAGPTLVVTLRMASRADADAIWSDAMSALGNFEIGSFLMQSHVEFDPAVGTSFTEVIHRIHVPAAVDDIP